MTQTYTYTPVNLIDNPIRFIETHRYAPELNRAYMENWESYEIAGCFTIEEAESYMQKHYE